MNFLYLILFCIASLCQASTIDHSLKHTTKNAWTVFTYIAADNDLNPYAQVNIQQMMEAGSNSERTFLVYLAETKQDTRYGKLLRIDKGAIVELSHDDNVDSGVQKTCLDACIKAFTLYPAQHYALIFWDHGSGCLNKPFSELFRGIAYNEPLDTYLDDKDVLDILRIVSDEILGGKKIDILGFDACLMASLELQTIYAPYADFYVASEENEDGPGWDYTGAFEHITNNSTPKEVATSWVTAFGNLYASQADFYTLSAIDLSHINLLVDNVNNVAQLLTKILTGDQAIDIALNVQKLMHHAHITCFDAPGALYDYVDLDHLYTNLIQALKSQPINEQQSLIHDLMTLLKDGRKLINNAVIANTKGEKHIKAGGISIYWAQEIIHPSYEKLVWTQMHPYWHILLRTYIDILTNQSSIESSISKSYNF